MTRVRGYKSSVEGFLHFGLGKSKTVDRILVEWYDGRSQFLHDQKSNQVLTIRISDASQNENKEEPTATPMYSEVSRELEIIERHKENEYDDFAKELLLPHKMSRFGPNIGVADVDGDNRNDFFRGGAAGAAGILYMRRLMGPSKFQPDNHGKPTKTMKILVWLFWTLRMMVIWICM